MGTVFLVLAVLAISMGALNRVFDSFNSDKKQKAPETSSLDKGGVVHMKQKEKKKPVEDKVKETTIKEEPASNTTSIEQTSSKETLLHDGISPQVIAAITAAVALMSDHKTSDFMVTSVRKVREVQSSGWVQSGRIGVINSRLSFYDRKGT